MSVTVGISLSLKRIREPNASASTDRSIMLTDAPLGTRPAISFIPAACRLLSLTKSRTVIPISETEGKLKIGIARFGFMPNMSLSHNFM
jgi:hypothetical protein